MKVTRSIVVASFLLVALLTGFFKKSLANEADTIRQANLEYASGYYEHALALYLSVTGKGFASSELYYNIGNAYFKLNRIPEAILYYERALRLAPRDENIRFNLELARTRTIDKIEPIPDLFYERWFRSLLNISSADGWGRMSIIFLFLSLMLAAVFLIASRRIFRVPAFYASLFLLVLSVTTLTLAAIQHHHRAGKPEAIVFDTSVAVKSSPSEASVDLFVIHEGTKLMITDQVGDWYEIRIASGSMGWLKAESVEMI